MEPPHGPPSGRAVWEQRWAERQGSEFCWYLAEPPQELARLLASGTVPAGAALDLGCGPGVVTAHLAGRFHPSIGIDIAEGAVREAAVYAREHRAPATFAVAAAPDLPFRREAFALVFDRGCLQNIPREAWGTYFREVERILAPGGVLHLMTHRGSPQKQGGALRELRSRFGRAARGAGQAREDAIAERVRTMAPSLRVLSVGRDRNAASGTSFLSAIFRKNA